MLMSSARTCEPLRRLAIAIEDEFTFARQLLFNQD